MTGVVVTFRGSMSNIAPFDTVADAEAFADWVRSQFCYDSVTVIGGAP